MSTPAELSSKLRAPSQRTQFNSAGELQTHEAYPSPLDIEIADALDSLQAQVEVMGDVIAKALLMHATGELRIAENDPAWPEQARAALNQAGTIEVGK